SGVTEAEQASSLVEGLAGSIVERRPEQLLFGVRADVEEHGVAAACEQAEERRLERLRSEVERGDVAGEMVDRDERQATRPSDAPKRRASPRPVRRAARR